MTGVCIGYHNQRFFTILCFYVSLGCLVGGYGFYNYLRNHSGAFLHSHWDYFLPITIYRLLFNDLPFHMFSMIGQMHVFVFICPMTLGFSLFNWASVFTGKTVHEIRRSEDIVVRVPMLERVADVFGRMWLLNFLFPAQLVFRQEGDGIHWRGVFDRGALSKLRQRSADLPPCAVKVAHVA